MIVAMPIVRMMETAVDDIVDMVAMRHRLMSTIRPMGMCMLVAGWCCRCRAGVRVGRADGQYMLDYATVGLLMMKMAVVQVIDVAVVFDALVSTTVSMPVFMLFVNRRHRDSPVT